MLKHLPDSRLLALANKINKARPFTFHDQRDLRHVAACDECFKMMRVLMLVSETTEMIDLTQTPAPAQTAPAAEENAIIRIVVMDIKAMMEQLQTQQTAWHFSEMPVFSGFRSADNENLTTILNDESNDKNTLVYDHESRTLSIQLDAATVSNDPRVIIKLPDGAIRPVPLERLDDIFWGEVTDLDEGEYEIILRK